VLLFMVSPKKYNIVGIQNLECKKCDHHLNPPATPVHIITEKNITMSWCDASWLLNLGFIIPLPLSKPSTLT